MSTACRNAFTLIEILVVIAIIGVLVGLLLPAVQSTRESARATSCKNNLINVHLAVEGYYGAFEVFPAGTITDRLPARMFPDGKDHSWIVQVRPFLDGGFEFADKWSPVHSAYHPRNWPLSRIGPNVMACPSSPFTHMSNVTALSYVGIHGGTDRPISDDSSGIFVANRFLRRSDISDGVSHTLQLGEISVELGNTFFWIAGNQSTLRTTGLPMRFPTQQGWWGAGVGEDRTSIGYGNFADPPKITYEMLESELANHRDEPNLEENITMALLQVNTDVTGDDGGQYSSVVPAYTLPTMGADSAKPLPLGSSHEGTVHGVFADGRVVSINQAIDSTLFSQIGNRNDAQPMETPLIQSE